MSTKIVSAKKSHITQSESAIGLSQSKETLIKQHATQLFIDYCQTAFKKQSNIVVKKDKVIIKNKQIIMICSIVNETVINIRIFQGIQKITENDKPDISINFNIKNNTIKNKIIGVMNNILTKTMPIELMANELVKFSLKKLLI